MSEQKIKTYTTIHLDFFDRLRVLFGANIEVEITTNIPITEKIEMYNASAIVKFTKVRTISSLKQDKPNYGLVHKG